MSPRPSSKFCLGLGTRETDRPHRQDEADRLRVEHEVFNALFDGRLVFPPLPALRRVLDCGFGAASWAIDVAEQFPTCEVRCDFLGNLCRETASNRRRIISVFDVQVLNHLPCRGQHLGANELRLREKAGVRDLVKTTFSKQRTRNLSCTTSVPPT